jgi:hypothetical protein
MPGRKGTIKNEGECRLLVDHYYSGKPTARDVVCKEYLNNKEESVIEEAVCPCDCDAQLVSERCGGRQDERDSREEG